VRRRLDQAGLTETRIFASGDLDEFVIADLLARGAQIDAFGIRTALATSKDAPALGGVYKLVDVASGDAPSYRAKFSEEKTTYPGRKQVFRLPNPDGSSREDVIARETEHYPEAELLLGPVMREGKRLVPSPTSFRSATAPVANFPACPSPAVAYKTPDPIPSASAASWKLCSKASATVSPNSPGRRAHEGHVATTALGCPARAQLGRVDLL